MFSLLSYLFSLKEATPPAESPKPKAKVPAVKVSYITPYLGFKTMAEKPINTEEDSTFNPNT